MPQVHHTEQQHSIKGSLATEGQSSASASGQANAKYFSQRLQNQMRGKAN